MTPARLAKGLIILEVGKTGSQYSIGKFSIVQFMSRERDVGLMTGMRAESHGIRITARKTFFCISRTCGPAPGPTQSHFQ